MVDPAIAAKFIEMLKKLGVSDTTCELVEEELTEDPKEEATETPKEEKTEDAQEGGAPKVMGVEVIKVNKASTPPSSDLNSAKSSLLKRMMA